MWRKMATSESCSTGVGTEEPDAYKINNHPSTNYGSYWHQRSCEYLEGKMEMIVDPSTGMS